MLINKNQKGFTLIEILAAMALTAIIVPALITPISQIFIVSAASTNRMVAIRQVENALHYINRDGQMAWPSQTPRTTGNSYFSTTPLTSASGVGATTLYLDTTTGFSAPGMVFVGTGASVENLTYSAMTATTLTVAAATKAHSSGEPASNALFLKWADNSGVIHVVTYSGLTVNGIECLQRSEIVGNEQPSVLTVADNIDLSNSYYTFDGKVVTLSLTALISGSTSASETRVLQVQLRPTQ